MDNNFKKYINNFFEKYIKIILPYDFFHVFKNLYIIVKNKKYKLILLWFCFLPIIFIYCLICLFLIIYYIIQYYFVFFYTLFLRYKKKKLKKNFLKKIKYKKIKILSNNEYIILIKKFFLETTSKIGFNIFYYLNNFIINWKKNKSEMDLNTFMYILYVIIFRLFFYLITHTPFLVIKLNTLLISKIQSANNIEFENFKTYVKFVWFNFIIDISSNLNLKIEKMRIIIKKNKIIFNPFKDEFLIYLKTKVLNLNLLKNSILDLSENLNLALISHQVTKENIAAEVKKIRNLKKLSKEELKDLENLEHKNFTTKPHLTVFFTEGNKTFHKNETSKDSLWVFDEEKNKFIELKLKYNHLGSLNKKLNTWYTPTIETDKKHIITEKNLAKIIINTKQQIIAKHNLSAAFLLGSDKKLLKTDYLEEKNKFVITKTETKTLMDELRSSGLNNELILDCFNKWDDFMLENKEIIEKIPEKYLGEFISDCLYERINDFKETTFFLVKK